MSENIQQPSSYSETIFFPIQDGSPETAQATAVERSEQVYTRLAGWAGWNALDSYGVTVRVQHLDVIPADNWRGPRAINITLTPHPFAGGKDVMPYSVFQAALKWAQEESCAHEPVVG
jgi:hypothetical protein